MRLGGKAVVSISEAVPQPAAVGPCCWCDRPFRARRTGGRAQRFCRPTCRRQFHAAARRWALEAFDAGALTLPEVKKGFAATCALSGRGLDPVAIPGAG